MSIGWFHCLFLFCRELSFYFTGILWSHILESSSEFLRSGFIFWFSILEILFWVLCIWTILSLSLTSGFLRSVFWKLVLLFGIWDLHRHFVISFFDFGVWFCWSKILYFVELRQPIPYFLGVPESNFFLDLFTTGF